MKKTALEVHYLVLENVIGISKSFRLYEFTGLNLENFVNTLCFVSFQKGLIQEY